MRELLQLLTACIGALGFALLYNTRGVNALLAAVGGFLGWAAFLGAGRLWGPNDYIGGFAASVMLTVYAECMARIRKTPVTVFLVSGAIPLVPGASLYRAMKYLTAGNGQMFREQSAYALLFAASMSTGIMVTTIVFRLCWSFIAKDVREKKRRI